MENKSYSRWRYWLRFHLPNALYLLILVAIAAGSYWWINQSSSTANSQQEKHPELADAFTSGMQINRTGKNGAVAYVITAKEVVHFGDKDAELKDVTVVATPLGQPSSSAHADTAQWSDTTHVIELVGNVVMDRHVTPDAPPMNLVTDAMTIGLYSNIASSDLPFVLKQGNDTITGRRFHYDYATRNIMMGGKKDDRVKGIFHNVKAGAVK